MKAVHLSRGFTLLELLAAITVAACLAGILMPALGKLRDRAESTACASNLRQIGLTALLYSGENNQRLPTIEPWPSQPNYAPEDGAKTILETLGPYGLTKQTLVCRTDIRNENYHAREGSSYEWCPMANGQNVQAVKLSWGGISEGIAPRHLIMAFDYSNVHDGKSNILFGDGHVAGAIGP